MEIKTNKRLRNALFRGLAAIFAALALIAATDFAFVRLLSGPADLGGFGDAAEGDYVTAGVSLILDYYAEGYAAEGGDAVSLYAVTADASTFYTVLLPKRFFDSASEIHGYTLDYMNGGVDALDQYFVVTGTVDKLTEDEKALFYDWFSGNADWLRAAGVIGEVTDYADYLSDQVLRVDYVGDTPAVRVYVLSSLAWLCLVYAVLVFIRWVLGRYAPIPEKKEAKKYEA